MMKHNASVVLRCLLRFFFVLFCDAVVSLRSNWPIAAEAFSESRVQVGQTIVTH